MTEKICPRHAAPCARGCPVAHCKSQAEADMGLSMPPIIVPREMARAFGEATLQHLRDNGITIGQIAIPPVTIQLGPITITADGVTYNGETIKDAGAVHAALLAVMNGRPLAPAPAVVLADADYAAIVKRYEDAGDVQNADIIRKQWKAARGVAADNEKLLTIIAAAYQVAGAHDAPARILDVLADPERATVDQVDAMLPYVPGSAQKSADLDEILSTLEGLARAATPGPWSWWTSNSFLRLTAEGGPDGGVLHSFTHRGNSDIACSTSDQAFIAAANPAAVLTLIAQVRAAQLAEETLLTPEEIAFVEVVRQRPGHKLNSGEDRGADGTRLWQRPQALGLIQAVGSYKWVVPGAQRQNPVADTVAQAEAQQQQAGAAAADAGGVVALMDVEDGQMVRIEVVGDRVPTGRYELRPATSAVAQPVAKDAARLDKFIDWYLNSKRFADIDPWGHVRVTTREHVLNWLDGGSNDLPGMQATTAGATDGQRHG